MKVERNQFTFYRSYYEALKNLDRQDIADTLMAIIEYALNDKEPEDLGNVAKTCYILIKPTLAAGRRKAENALGKKKAKTNGEENSKGREDNSGYYLSAEERKALLNGKK